MIKVWGELDDHGPGSYGRVVLECSTLPSYNSNKFRELGFFCVYLITSNELNRNWIDLIGSLSWKENGFTFKKKKGRWYPSETMTNADYADDLVLLANTPA